MYEIELDGDFEYVQKKFEELLSKLYIIPANQNNEPAK